MKKVLILTIVTVLSFAVLPAWAQEQQVPPDIENWQLIPGSEERIILNAEYESGVVRRYYLDPNLEQGVGITDSVFYRDGTEVLYWKYWMVHTDRSQAALLLNSGEWYVSEPAKAPYGMMSWAEILASLNQSDSDAFVEGKPMMDKMTSCPTDKTGTPLTDKTSTIWFEKNSAIEANPAE